MPGSVASPNLMMDPGYLWLAPPATLFPLAAAMAPTASKFPDTPGVSWIEIGATEDGHRFKYSPSIEPVTVAEFADPVVWRTVGREGSFAFNLADYTLANMKRAMNGGTISTVSGSGVTLLSKWAPPTMGNEVRSALLWESFDATMRIFIYQAINVAEMESAFAKAPAAAMLPCEFRFEVPLTGPIFEVYTAGTARLGL
jgi:hypothetical protein